ncbi:hypothetical protein MAPG_07474 [Magnaporthiopsis poae ATCC 64411]|uniref:Uncharacterized protein n=1 Tax=Magnaporthiopsis poae (strain ATCC 64411 / 73-15) TaxID=644358 RepID=A0A0C4E4S3_MAGP6|nr:hypothetical protein MAPG_07474 [Magnaporthiopsis poae ATCC 64411]
MSDSVRQGTVVLVPTAFLLSVLVLGQTISRYASAYVSAPTEVLVFIDALDSSVEENESYDRDLTRVPRLEDKLRLGRLLREIQKAGDDLRDDLNSVLVPASAYKPGLVEITGGLKGCGGSGSNMAVVGLTTARLRMPARILWASRRSRLSERLRRMDMLRMRFLVVYMGIVSSPPVASEKTEKALPAMPSTPERSIPIPPAPPLPSHPHHHFPALGVSMGEKRKPPMRRLTTQAMGHHDATLDEEKFGGTHRRGWAGVVQELQRSPLMHKRHASIENHMRRAQTP